MNLHATVVSVAFVAAASVIPSNTLACEQCDGKKQRGQWSASSTQVIEASPEQVMAVITDFRQWPEWTAWSHERDPEGEWSFEGDPGTVGHSMSWDGKELGRGHMELTELRFDGLDFDLYFGRSKKVNEGSFYLQETDAGTQVTWVTTGPLGLMGRLFRGTIEEAVAADFDQGLASLEQRVEAAVAVETASEPEPEELIPAM